MTTSRRPLLFIVAPLNASIEMFGSFVGVMRETYIYSVQLSHNVRGCLSCMRENWSGVSGVCVRMKEATNCVEWGSISLCESTIREYMGALSIFNLCRDRRARIDWVGRVLHVRNDGVSPFQTRQCVFNTHNTSPPTYGVNERAANIT